MSMKRRGLLFCLAGPAGAGKNTIGAALAEAHAGTLVRSVSCASRPPRSGEQEGRDYFFISEEEFRRRIARGEFFEWEQVHGNLYGTLNETLTSAIEQGRDLLLIIDIRGSLNVKRRFPADTFIAFVTPSAFTAIEERMRARGGLSEREIEVRLETARAEYRRLLDAVSGDAKNAPSVDYLLVNDDLRRACAGASAILEAERQRISRVDSVEVEGTIGRLL